ncbi:hypothetical protein [Streptomyces sp. NPDC090083]|uniref:hypothetical protein n=1 Tax=Streptomyces sp. NPDC090083 TaxID=3365941 RepID=UPI003809DBCB
MSQDTDLEKIRARYGLLAVVGSNLAITAVAIFGVWQLNGDRAVIVGVLTSAFTAMAGLTTAYLGIKAVSNTAQSMSKEAGRQPDAGIATATGADSGADTGRPVGPAVPPPAEPAPDH